MPSSSPEFPSWPRWTGLPGVLLLLILALCPGASKAESSAQGREQAKARSAWLERAPVRQFISEMSQRHDFDQTALTRLIEQAQASDTVLRLVAPPAPGFKRSWSAYRQRFIEPVRIRGGLRFWKQHGATLARAEREFGVPASIIVAIIGIETLYGTRMGEFRLLDALTTLAFDDPRRSDYFREELKQFLLLTRESGLDPLTLRGSFAGAIGMPQFMPGSVRRHAVDFNGDGRIDLRSNTSDAIGSVANFLRRHGWQPGLATHHPVTLEDEVNAAPAVALGIPPRLPARELADYGLSTTASLPPEQPLVLVDLPDGDAPTHYVLGTQNFNAITSYNRSYFYAMAVIDLAEVLARERQAPRASHQPGKRSIDR